MSERLPYEEQLPAQWNDLPLPDENMAWADMKRRLEEDNDKPLLPIWLRGCMGWGLLMILVLGLGWWILRPGKWFRKKEENPQTKGIAENKTNSDSVFTLKDSSSTTAKEVRPGSPDSAGTAKVNPGDKDIPGKIIPGTDEIKNVTNKQKKPVTFISPTKGKSKPQPVRTSRNKIPVKKKDNIISSGDVENKQERQTDSIETGGQEISKIAKTDSPALVIKKEIHTDTVQKTKTDSARKDKTGEPVAEKKPKKDSTKSKQLSFSAGIGLQQQLPLAGQKFVPYNSQGRKGTLGDYIPSVYLRLSKPGKWFLQTEFRYGAPQYTKEILFRQQVINDTGQAPRFKITNSSTLKKTYYHQLPLTFNYFVLPDWSLGAGIQWNKFSSAVYERQELYHDNTTQLDTVRSKTIQALDTASGFKRSYFQAVIETQYQRKRFSFGARYTFGLQPYLRFTLPGGTAQEEKNSALQLFLRYRLWSK
ncbi:MAG: hypothetical protein ABIT05_14690 [Chitinophagaceae bacterium]